MNIKCCIPPQISSMRTCELQKYLSYLWLVVLSQELHCCLIICDTALQAIGVTLKQIGNAIWSQFCHLVKNHRDPSCLFWLNCTRPIILRFQGLNLGPPIQTKKRWLASLLTRERYT